MNLLSCDTPSIHPPASESDQRCLALLYAKQRNLSDQGWSPTELLGCRVERGLGGIPTPRQGETEGGIFIEGTMHQNPVGFQRYKPM